MSREVVISTAFKKDMKKLKGKDTGKLKELIGLLTDGLPIPAGYRDHALTGQWKGYRDAHIEPDWLLITGWMQAPCILQEQGAMRNYSDRQHFSPARRGVMNHAEKADTLTALPGDS